ncbi:YdcF family protein [Inmirania thermothiophila]|uniref:Uncharacterized SAM-binding protein YcdF (DUF218 family) n=1 Tax=Inmirania thermothiophila TaxID=1750597 RepID=A0A3N1Y6D3_9GAMM|nr:YdcF family protein [Inmirania thermothiophila]ROR32867.1 uncharacterized SAM-binding protein YcdF (DUF218 family) [Inmirania thermothiophila]
MDILTARTLETLLYPPAGPLLLALAALALRGRLRRLLVGLALAALWLGATPWLARLVTAPLERDPALDAAAVRARGAQAIVVLAYTRYPDAPEYGGDTSGAGELVRLRWAARLQRETGLPLAVIGGDPLGTGTAEAEIMTRVLARDFGVAVRWADGRSRHTFDNARYAAALLLPEGVRRIALVTHAWHMPRAVQAFRAAGFEVIPSPTGFTTADPTTRGWRALLPNADALVQTRRALHEWIGRAVYALGLRP